MKSNSRIAVKCEKCGHNAPISYIDDGIRYCPLCYVEMLRPFADKCKSLVFDAISLYVDKEKAFVLAGITMTGLSVDSELFNSAKQFVVDCIKHEFKWKEEREWFVNEIERLKVIK